ncbi:MAG: AtzE family amidohydrolase, partial [Methylobacterium mesophilicum]|nr:AtzE family amidohydrolase [Methylobacterium mesophilicum]
MSATQPLSAVALADAVNRRQRKARDVMTEALARIERHDPSVNAFTDVLAGRALAQADALDDALDGGGPPKPLAGVPFAVKNLIDIAGLPTRA